MSNTTDEPEADNPPAVSRTPAGLPKRVPFSGPHPGDHGRGAISQSPPPLASPALTAAIAQAVAASPARERAQQSFPTSPPPLRTGIDPAPGRVDPPDEPPSGTAPAARGRRTLLVPIGLVVVLALAAALLWFDRNPAPEQPGSAEAVTPQTSAPTEGAAAPGSLAPPSGQASSGQSPSGQSASGPLTSAAPPSHVGVAPAAGTTARPTPTASANTTGRDLALHRPATASGTEGAAWAPANAVDGVADTRWSSAFSDPQWLSVDLGARWQISKIVIRWENAYATAYRVEVSTDGTAWHTVFSTAQGQGGDITVKPTGVSARYVRLYGTHRIGEYGYSVYELEVH